MAEMLKRRDFVRAVGGLVVAGAAAGVGTARPVRAQRRFDGQTLHVRLYTGQEGGAIRSAVIDPLAEKTGVRVVATEGHTINAIAKLRAEKANPSISVVTMDDIGVVTAGRDGLLEPLDLSRLPNAVDIEPKFFVEGKGVGFGTYITTVIYNTDLVKSPPTSWKVLWDPQYKGKVAIPPVVTGTFLHMAIAAATVNGGSQYNMEPAWEALKALKPSVAVMEGNTAVLAELLRTGELALVVRIPYLFKPYIEKGYPIGTAVSLKEGVFAVPMCAAVVKNHPDKREVADAFVNGVLSPEAQTKMAHMLWFGPTNRKVKLPPEVARNLVSTQEQWDSVIPLNLDNMAAHREEWLQKYTRALL